MRFASAVACCCLCSAARGGPVAAPPPVPSALADYVNAPDPAFKWAKAADPVGTPAGTLHTLTLTSQEWHGVAWTHDLQIVVPPGARLDGTVLLWNQGGKASVGSSLLAAQLAARAKVPVAFLYGVPAQPLFGGKSEDALIAETFVRYLDTGDATWPLLFPMVKSVVRAMDAVQAYAKADGAGAVTGFVVTGASKRGWTAWLSAATGDARVKAVAPIVYDNLNLPAQMQNQVKAFGGPSHMIRDYTARGLVPIPDTDRAQKLWRMVDPYTYRDRLTLPKLVITGTNDPYWPVDAATSYWPDLPGPKYLLHVPNAGHDLREVGPGGKKQALPERAANTLAAFARSVARGIPMPAQPAPAVARSGAGAKVTLEDRLDHQGGFQLWTAGAATADFRQARWTPHETKLLVFTRGQVFSTTIDVPAPAAGGPDALRAAFVEVGCRLDELKFTLSTPVVLVPAKAAE